MAGQFLATFGVVWDFFSKLFDTSDYPARWHCGRWTSEVGWLHILSDLAIFSAYTAIPLTLVVLMMRRRNYLFPRVGCLIVSFILACGTTHLVDAFIFYHPVYRLSGLMKFVTAVVSWTTVIALIRIAPEILKLPEISLPSGVLTREIAERQAAERRLRAIVQTIPDALIVADEKGIIKEFNRAAEKLFGYQASEMLGQDLPRLIPPRLRDRHSGSFEHAKTAPAEIMHLRREVLGLHKDGTEMPLELDLGSFQGEDGHWMFIAVAHDLTEQRIAIEALRDSERRYRELVEGLPAAIYTTDAEGKIQLFNKAAEDCWGRRPSIGKNGERWSGAHKIFDLQGNIIPHDSCPMALAVRENRAIRGAEIAVERPDGSRATCQVYPTPLRDASGALIGAVNMLVDVTERLRTESQIRELLDRERVRSERQRLLADAALEINTATSIDGVLKIITEKARQVIPSHQAASSMSVNDRLGQAIHSVSLSEKYAAWNDYSTPPTGKGIYGLVCRTNRPMRPIRRCAAGLRFRMLGREGGILE